MLNKFLILFMTMTLFTVQTNAATHNSLKTAFDDLNYSLTVEWDQKDRSFYNAQMEKFATEVKGLQAQGMSNQELIDFTLSQLKDQKMAKDLETAFNMVAINKMGAEEAHRYVTDVMNKSYSRGASWAGEVVAGVIALIIFVAVAAIVAGSAKLEDGCYKVRTCEEYCGFGACYEECDFRCL